MNIKKYEETTKKDWYRTGLILFLFTIVIILSSILFLPHYWYFWLLIIITGTLLLIIWHTRNFVYRCPKCSHVFEVSILENFLGPNGVNKKYLRCPKCGKRGWAEILRIKK